MTNSDNKPITLYDHQVRILEKNPPRYGIFHSTGVGKTITGIYLANKNCMSVLVIVPKTNKQDWIDNMNEHCLVPEWTVLTKEEFKRDASKLQPYEGVIVDECFTGDTRVQTPSGRIPIKDIKIGFTVVNAFGIGIVKNIGIKQVDKILKIKLSDGSIISVTENHPLLTTTGWTTAGKLQKGSVLLHYLHVHDILDVYEKNNLCDLRKGNNKSFSGKDTESVRSCLSREINLEEQQDQNGKFLNKFVCRQLKSCEDFVRENEKKQSNVKPRECFKNERNAKKNRTQTKNKRWKWTNNANTSENFISRSWGRLVCRTLSFNKKINELSIQLQNRYCKPSKNDCDRGGWTKPCFTREKTTRHEEGYSFKGIRVESIQVQKQGGNGQFTVYNLEVSGHPSYVVENIVAHNCHYFFGIKSQLSKTLMAYLKKHDTPYRWLMTATPYLSTPLNIYVAGKLLGHNWNYAYFTNQFFYRINMGGRLISKIKPGMEEELSKLVKAIGETVDMGSLVTVPEQTFLTYNFQLTEPQIKAIQELDEPVFISRWTKKHQIENGHLYNGDTSDEGTGITTHYINEKSEWILKNIKDKKKVAIFCRYKEQIAQYKALISYMYPERPIFELHGDVKDRYTVIHDADNAPEAVILIQSECSAGYELPSFDFIIFASLSFSYVSFKQALGRFLRINRLKENTFVHLVVDGVDRDVYNCIMRKEDFSINLYKN
jgi:hypothetical protein